MVQQSSNNPPNWVKELEAFQKKYHFVFDEDVLAETAKIVYEKTKDNFKLTCQPYVFIYGVARRQQKRKRSKRWKEGEHLNRLMLGLNKESATASDEELSTALLESPEHFKRLYTKLNYFRIMQRLDNPKERKRLKMLIARRRDELSWEEVSKLLKIKKTYSAAKSSLSGYKKRLGRKLPKPCSPIIEDILYGVKISMNCPYVGLTIYDAHRHSLERFFDTIDEILNKRVLFIGQCRNNTCNAMTLLAAQNYSWDILIANEQPVKFPAAIKRKKQPIYAANLEIALQFALRRLPHYGAIIVDSSVHGRFNNLSKALEDHKRLSQLLSPIISTD